MSNTDNKAKSCKQPNIKKSSRSNTIIPLILILVSAIVIIATIYKDEYKDQIAEIDFVKDPNNSTQNDVQDVALATADVTNSEAITENTATFDPQLPTSTDEVISNSTSTSTAKEAVALTIQTSTETSPIIKTTTTDKTIAANKSSEAENEQARQNIDDVNKFIPTIDTRPTYQRTQQQAENHNKIMQQHRQTYKKRMQERRQNYLANRESARKAQQKGRIQITGAQKAVYQRAQQHRIENRKRLKELHAQISEIHKEIHQIMQSSQQHSKSSAPTQLQSPSKEQM